ncbi:MAG: glycosyltransferase family 4 protein [Anaerolineae bacterium]|nr:glycosyltransferase family 4 protein [Anaerolineae bacterium]
MRVVMVSFDAGEYGVQLSSALAEHADVLLISSEDRVGPHRRMLSPKVKLYSYVQPRLRHPLAQIKLLRKLYQVIRAFNPDVVHVQHAHLWFSLLLPWARRYPLVITVHDPIHHVGDRESQRTPQRLVHWGYRLADELVIHAQQLKKIMADQLGFPAEKLHVIPHVAHGLSGAPDNIAENERLLLFFGRIWEYKGLDYLIRAEPLVAEHVPDVQIMIAGRGEDFQRYRDMMVHPERFIVHNEYISDEKTAEYFAQSAVVVLPYVDASQSGVIPFAYSFSKPVVVTNVGGLPEMVDDGVTGLLVPPRDERALADALVRLLQDRDLRHRMGAAGKKKLDEECAPDVVARSTIAVYQRAIDGRQRGHAAASAS